MKRRARILIVQEILPHYRKVLFNMMAKENDSLTVFSDKASGNFLSDEAEHKNNFKHVTAEWKVFLSFKYSMNFFHQYRKNDILMHVADFKFLTLWITLFLNPFTKKKLFLHGQGGFKNDSLLHSFFYTIACFFASGYICYNNFSRNALLNKIPNFLSSKISVCENTLSIKENSEVNKEYSGHILYIGRLRLGCNLEILLEAARRTNNIVKVVGSGEQEYMTKLKSQFGSTVKFYGAIFEEHAQRKIAEDCICGAYGGNAGLSVVHYMALGLPVLVHGDIKSHMGPEPSYIKDDVNGLLFEKGSIHDLASKLNLLSGNPDLRNRLATGALITFHELNKIPMSTKLLSILESKL